MSGSQQKRKFEKALRESLPNGFELPSEIWALIQWLEDNGQCFQYLESNALFVPTMPVESIDHVWSDLAFVIEPDLVRHWFGKDGLEAFLVPLVKCAADGSHLAVWKNGENTEFVFLGSEGEAFKVTSSVRHFIVLITMGYLSLHDRHSMTSDPADNYGEYYDGRWPNPAGIKQHIQSTLSVKYPATGESLIDNDEDDPFVKWVEETLKVT